MTVTATVLTTNGWSPIWPDYYDALAHIAGFTNTSDTGFTMTFGDPALAVVIQGSGITYNADLSAFPPITGGTETSATFYVNGVAQLLITYDPGNDIVAVENAVKTYVDSGNTNTSELADIYQTQETVFNGNTGNDSFLGSFLADEAYGGKGRDTLNGDDGDDYIEGGLNGDFLEGGGNDEGGDTVSYAHSASGVTVDLALTTAQRGGGDATGDILSGFENILGSGKADRLSGDDFDNVLTGGLGKDSLTGRLGADTFVFDSILDTAAKTSKADVIFDFEEDEDQIDLSVLAESADVTLTFSGNATFSHTAGEIIDYVKKGKTYISGDTNGDGTADFSITLVGVHALSATDFILA